MVLGLFGMFAGQVCSNCVSGPSAVSCCGIASCLLEMRVANGCHSR